MTEVPTSETATKEHPLCPRCHSPEIDRMVCCGQDSWECVACGEWGPWEQATGEEPYRFGQENGGV